MTDPGAAHPLEHLDVLSERGNERLRRLGFSRDPARTCDRARLEGLLFDLGLPALPELFDVERDLGGVRKEMRGGGGLLCFGAYQVLTDEVWQDDYKEWAAESALLEHGDDWPRVTFEGQALVPVGSHVETLVYARGGPSLLAHDWTLDEVAPVARSAVVAFERWLIQLDVRERLLAGAAVELREEEPLAGTLAPLLGLSAAPYASDDLAAWWEDEAGRTWLFEDLRRGSTWLVATEPGVVDRARAALAAAPRST